MMQLDLANIIQLLNLASLLFLIGKVFYREGVRDTRLKQMEGTLRDNTEEQRRTQGVVQIMEKSMERTAAILDRLSEDMGLVRVRSHEHGNKLVDHESRLAETEKLLGKIEERFREHELEGVAS